ncbi:putative MFS monocarboxylate transporter [Xylona heveae TC161]|uniref:Putative MFS monocarboxylate transporter n=1 Tax=Xylona heveae (strain CBS 132557 / TC161) TaxID=1328760 RepID=A0A165J7Z9_XYLHT|nr:putative MFS monocarboxylate transporter [Xylona heveae TC161]KZF25870.1 putative MFS monocarboxylate transporter [Xylona heveae TC161]
MAERNPDHTVITLNDQPTQGVAWSSSSSDRATPDEKSEVLPSDTEISASQTKEAEAAAVANINNAIPNGGLQAWLQVLGAFFLFFNSWGIINTFGAFESYYQSTTLKGYSSGTISWIGTVQGFLLVAGGIVTGPLYDRGYLRHLLIGGNFLVSFGMMMTSLGKNYWEIFLAQALCVGIGAACLFVPSVAIVATYFSTKRAVAIGISAAGGSVGGVIYPIVFRRLTPEIGAPWATRIIGFIAFATLCISTVVMKPRILPSGPRALLDLPAFKEAPFTFFSIGLFCCFMGIYIPFFDIPIFGAVKIGTSVDFSFYLLSIMNAASALGRIIPNLIADRLGYLNVLIPFSVASAIVALAWIRIDNDPGTIVFSALFGFLSGAIVSLPPTVAASLSPDLKKVGTRMGMCFCFAALGLLIGNPIGDVLLNIPEKKFYGAQAFSGSMILGGAGFYIIARLFRRREYEHWKA